MLKDSIKVSLELFRIMIPIVIAVKILTDLGVIEYLAVPLSGLMNLVGLPANMGLVWAAAMINNLYSGIIVYAVLLPDMAPLSVAQVTVLAVMMLIAHNLPVESRIGQKCGVGFWTQVIFRICGALACGAILNLIFTHWSLLAQPSALLFTPMAPGAGWGGWALDLLKNMAYIVVVITVLMTLMSLLKKFGLTDLLNRLLRPVLRLLGIGGEAATVTVIGLTMGIAYGGGLIIHEVQNGRLSRKDVFSSISLMGLSHALIEDSMLMLLLGASVYGVLWGRLIFSLVVVAIMTRLLAGRTVRA